MLQMRGPLHSGTASLEVLEDWADAVRESLMRMETFNMSPSTVMEALFLRMREAARGEFRQQAAETSS